jgi:hypothetical protein
VTRNSAGAFILSLTGTNIVPGGQLFVGGVSPKKVQFGAVQGGVTTSITAKGKFCANLPGPITYTNPDGTVSAALQCNATCATQ